jgi:hypothetical protein
VQWLIVRCPCVLSSVSGWIGCPKHAPFSDGPEESNPFFNDSLNPSLHSRAGSEILKGFENGTLEFTWMGRKGGLDGTSLAQDVQTGKWRSFQYECRFDPLPVNPNWFPVTEFVARLRSEQIPPHGFS